MLLSKKLVLSLLFLTAVASENPPKQLSWESLSPQLNAYVSRPFSSFLGKIYHNPQGVHEQLVVFDSMNGIDKKYRSFITLMLTYKSVRQLNALRDPSRGAHIVKDKGYYYMLGQWGHPKESDEEDNPDDMDNEPVVEYLSEKEMLEQIFWDRTFYKGMLKDICVWNWNPEK